MYKQRTMDLQKYAQITKKNLIIHHDTQFLVKYLILQTKLVAVT